MFNRPRNCARRGVCHALTLLLCACASAAVIGASAQSKTQPALGSEKDWAAAFAQADKDRDKSLSPFEARHLPVVAKDFARYDQNGDNFLSYQEFMAAMKSAKDSGKK